MVVGRLAAGTHECYYTHTHARALVRNASLIRKTSKQRVRVWFTTLIAFAAVRHCGWLIVDSHFIVVKTQLRRQLSAYCEENCTTTPSFTDLVCVESCKPIELS